MSRDLEALVKCQHILAAWVDDEMREPSTVIGNIRLVVLLEAAGVERVEYAEKPPAGHPFWQLDPPFDSAPAPTEVTP